MFLICGLPALLAGSCALQPPPQPTEAPPITTTEGPTVTPTEGLTPIASRPARLRIWLPPQFDPESGTEAGELLRGWLVEFAARNDEIEIEVRVKVAAGNGGLLSSLSAAHAAAPLALPDLIALPRADLEAAAIKGLVFPVSGMTNAFENSDWFDYAVSLARVQEDIFGFPFAGDTLALVYRPAIVGEPPQDWASALDLNEPLTFPAGAPDALFPLALYMAAGGQILDDQGRPALNVTILTEVLEFLQNGEQTGLLPFWLTQYDTFDLALQAYRENRAHLAVNWVSNYLNDPLIDTVPAGLPTPTGDPFTLATGWVWALSRADSARQESAVRLAEHLTDPRFLGEWTEAAGYLPPRSAALGAWPDSPLRALFSQIVLAAEIVPSTDVLTILGPVLQEATTQVLRQQSDPTTAAQQAADRLAGP